MSEAEAIRAGNTEQVNTANKAKEGSFSLLFLVS